MAAKFLEGLYTDVASAELKAELEEFFNKEEVLKVLSGVTDHMFRNDDYFDIYKTGASSTMRKFASAAEVDYQNFCIGVIATDRDAKKDEAMPQNLKARLNGIAKQLVALVQKSPASELKQLILDHVPGHERGAH